MAWREAAFPRPVVVWEWTSTVPITRRNVEPDAAKDLYLTSSNIYSLTPRPAFAQREIALRLLELMLLFNAGAQQRSCPTVRWRVQRFSGTATAIVSRSTASRSALALGHFGAAEIRAHTAVPSAWSARCPSRPLPPRNMSSFSAGSRSLS